MLKILTLIISAVVFVATIFVYGPEAFAADGKVYTLEEKNEIYKIITEIKDGEKQGGEQGKKVGDFVYKTLHPQNNGTFDYVSINQVGKDQYLIGIGFGAEIDTIYEIALVSNKDGNIEVKQLQDLTYYDTKKKKLVMLDKEAVHVSFPNFHYDKKSGFFVTTNNNTGFNNDAANFGNEDATTGYCVINKYFSFKNDELQLRKITADYSSKDCLDEKSKSIKKLVLYKSARI